MKKNLSILTYSLASGGAERVVSILLNELQNKYNITLFLMNDTIFYDIPDDVNIVYLEKSNSNENKIVKLLKLPFLGFKYKQLCKKYNIDVSFSFMNRPNYINILSRIFGNPSKIIISERIAPSKEYETSSLKDFISRYLIKNLYTKADVIVPNSLGIKYDLISNFDIKSNIEVINNPIDINKIKKLKDEEVTDFKFENFTFITVGRLEDQKNHSLIIDAFKSLNNDKINLIIIGEGYLRKKLEYQINNLDLESNVFLLGRKENPYKYLSKSNCFILSSNYEGFPNVLLEALACDIPIISVDCISGPREILSLNSNVVDEHISEFEVEEFGILTPVNNSVVLSNAMQNLYMDKELMQHLKYNSKIRIKNFEKDIILKKYIDLIEDV